MQVADRSVSGEGAVVDARSQWIALRLERIGRLPGCFLCQELVLKIRRGVTRFALVCWPCVQAVPQEAAGVFLGTVDPIAVIGCIAQLE